MCVKQIFPADSHGTLKENSFVRSNAPVTREQNPLAPALEVRPGPLFKPIEPKSERVESAEKPAQTSRSPSPAAQSSPTLRADNRLLELLEKDLEKAVEQPKERRRLQ